MVFSHAVIAHPTLTYFFLCTKKNTGGDSCYYDSRQHIIRASDKGSWVVKGERLEFVWKTGDIIRLVLDVDNGKCTFYRNSNKKEFADISIEKSIKWHPVFCCCACDGSSKFELCEG